METFLELVAKDLYKELNGDFTSTTVIFPNKRANLFFNSHLANITDGPVWTPFYTSISDIFANMSNLTICDPIKLVCKLYEAFQRCTQTTETLDKFYSWGEMMLSDFEDIDNNMADANKLFANISDLEKMTDFSFLSENQVKAIRQFFDNFDPENHTRLKDKFLSIWNALYPTYLELNKSLREENLCYEAMMKREIINTLKTEPEKLLDKLPSENYVIVGFNVLNETERQLFKFLQQNKNTYFYWDYDEAYKDYEAGRFVKQDIEMFGNRFADHPEYYKNFSKKKNIRFIASPTENAQSRFVGQWIQENIHSSENLNENAVVLCNESILPSVLHSIPPVLGENEEMALNVTMGYPLGDTPVFSFVQALMELQIHGKADKHSWKYTQVANVLRHPFTRKLSGNHSVTILNHLKKSNIMFPSENDLIVAPTGDTELLISEERSNQFLATLFTHQNSQKSIIMYVRDVLKMVGASYKSVKDETLQKESIFNAYTIINRILTLQEEEDAFKVNEETLYRLVRQIMSAKSIPFHGEPAIGLQVMGVLETRNLDFKNVILLSCNEDMLPKNTHKASLIPYNLREAHGMTTMEKQVSLYAYHFYNLLQRAEDITIMYNSSTDGLNKGEMSRFMMQMQIESDKILGKGQEIIELNITAANESQTEEDGRVTKTDEVMKRMNEHFANHPLSPSAINTYLRCPLQFYFQHVALFKQQDEVVEEVDNPTFGNIFHYCMEQIYKPFIGRQIQSGNLLEIARNKDLIEQLVDEGFAVQFFNKPKGQERYVNKYNGQQRLNHYVLCKYIKNQLEFDAKFCPFSILGLEEYISQQVDIDGTKVMLGGYIDRYETLYHEDGSESIRIVDYKSGGSVEQKGKTEDLFNGKCHYMFQAFYYCNILLNTKDPKKPIQPSLMFAVQAPNNKDDKLYLDRTAVTNYAEYKSMYEEGLVNIIKDIYDQGKPFTKCEDVNKCAFCNFKNFCKR